VADSYLLSPILHIDDFKNGFEAYAGSKSLSGNPMLQFVLVHQHALEHYNDQRALELATFDVLHDFLHNQFSTLRRLYQRPEPNDMLDYDQAIQDMQADDEVGRYPLTTCSYLYYRYLRSDLNFTVEELAECFSQSKGHLRRQVRAYWKTLCQDFLREELKARSAAWKQQALLALPRQRITRLETQRKFVETNLQRLKRTHAIQLVGEPGIGKSTLAILMARQLVEEEVVHQVIYLRTTQDPMPSNLGGLVLKKLGAEIDGQPEEQLIRYLAILDNAEQRLLIVIDDAEAWEETITSANSWLSHCLFITTGIRSLSAWRGLTVVCPHLSREDSKHLLRYFDWSHDREVPLDYGAIIEDVGGNPLLLLRAFQSWDNVNYTSTALLNEFYQANWHQVSDDAQRVWCLVDLLSDAVDIAQVRELADSLMQGDMAVAAIDELVSYRLLVRERGDIYRYHIEPIVRASIIETDRYLDVIRELCHQADFAGYSLQLLDRAPQRILAFDVFFSLFDMARAQMFEQGAWERWLSILMRLRLDLLPDHARVDVLIEKAITFRWLGQLRNAREAVAEALKEASVAHNLPLQVKSLVEQSKLLFYLGDNRAAERTAETAYNLLDDMENGYSQHDDCILALAQARAVRAPESALDLLESIQLANAQVWDLVARLELRLNKPKAALRAAKMSVDLSSHPVPLARARGVYARALDANRDYERAIREFDIATNILQINRDILGLARMLTNLGVTCVRYAAEIDDVDERSNTLDHADDVLTKALGYYEKIQDRNGEKYAREALAYVAQLRADSE
jgi:tetratricopeptide (TPR) repeat protein/DNA polymerase III delta prime subunit